MVTGALGNWWLIDAERFLWSCCCRPEKISYFPELVLHLRRRGLQRFHIEVQDAQSVLHMIQASLADEILTFYWLSYFVVIGGLALETTSEFNRLPLLTLLSFSHFVAVSQFHFSDHNQCCCNCQGTLACVRRVLETVAALKHGGIFTF